MDSESEYFRANVGALIFRSDGSVLTFQRSGGLGGEWQMPQGGLMHGEAPWQAVLREVQEETSIHASKLQIVDEIDEWLGYELPPAYRSGKTERGQVQKWFALRFTGSETDVRPNGSEFLAWKWISGDELPGAAVDFRRAVYRRVIERFAAHLRGDRCTES